MSEQGLSNLLADLYGAATGRDGLAAVAAPLARFFDAESCLIQEQRADAPSTSVLSRTDNFTDQQMQAYAGYYFSRDVWRDAGIGAGSDHPIIVSELIPDSVLLNTEFYEDWLKPTDMFRCAGSVKINALGMTALAVHRPRLATDFNESDKARLRLVMPHYARAVEIASRFDALRVERRLAFAALDALDTGLAVVNALGQIFYANALAEAYFQQGAALIAENGRIQAIDPATAEALARAIGAAVANGIGAAGNADARIVLDQDPRADRLNLYVCPLPPGAVDGEPGLPPCAMVFIDRTSRRIRLDERLLGRLYGLTPAEARLAMALVNGAELRGYAEALSISYYTARAHLRSIFQKTGHSRQADLIRDIVSNPVPRLMSWTSGR
jgi:DNA-binding CsgD family transcriptional regulator